MGVMIKMKLTRARQRAMWARLKARGIREKPIAYEKTKRYERFRIRSPNQFQKGSLRTLTLSKKNGLKLIIGRPLGKRITKTQSVLIERMR
jgi:hypothetical protein